MRWILLGALLALLAAFFVACSSAERIEASRALAESINTAMADGIVTPRETGLIQAKLDGVRTSPSHDWGATVYTVLGSIASTLAIVRGIPNRFILGAREAAAVDRFAYPT